jgi:hypothetical protein
MWKAGHIARMGGIRNAHKIFNRKHRGGTRFMRGRHILDDRFDSKIYLKETAYEMCDK